MSQNKAPSIEDVIRELSRPKVNQPSTRQLAPRAYFGSTPKFGPFIITIQECDGNKAIMVNDVELPMFADKEAAKRISDIVMPTLGEQLVPPKTRIELTNSVSDLLESQSKQVPSSDTTYCADSEEFGRVYIDPQVTPEGGITVKVNGAELSLSSCEPEVEVITQYAKTFSSAEGFGTRKQAQAAGSNFTRAVLSLYGKSLKKASALPAERTVFVGNTPKFGPFTICVQNSDGIDVLKVNGLELYKFAHAASVDTITRLMAPRVKDQSPVLISAENSREITNAVASMLELHYKQTSFSGGDDQPETGVRLVGLGSVELDVGDGFIFEYTERVNKKPRVLLNGKKLKSRTTDIKPVREVAAFLLTQFGGYGGSIDDFIVDTLNGIAKTHQAEKEERAERKIYRSTNFK